jgi:HemY protein
VACYAETGELIHPRLERRERVLNDLPELPEGYRLSAPFRPAPAASLPPPPDVPAGLDDDDEAGIAAPGPAPRRRAKARKG